MTDRELMQMALGAMEKGWGGEDEQYEAIKALRKRLAEPPASWPYKPEQLKGEWVELTDEEVFQLSERIECCKYSICAAEELLKKKNTRKE